MERKYSLNIASVPFQRDPIATFGTSNTKKRKWGTWVLLAIAIGVVLAIAAISHADQGMQTMGYADHEYSSTSALFSDARSGPAVQRNCDPREPMCAGSVAIDGEFRALSDSTDGTTKRSPVLYNRMQRGRSNRAFTIKSLKASFSPTPVVHSRLRTLAAGPLPMDIRDFRVSSASDSTASIVETRSLSVTFKQLLLAPDEYGRDFNFSGEVELAADMAYGGGGVDVIEITALHLDRFGDVVWSAIRACSFPVWERIAPNRYRFVMRRQVSYTTEIGDLLDSLRSSPSTSSWNMNITAQGRFELLVRKSDGTSVPVSIIFNTASVILQGGSSGFLSCDRNDLIPLFVASYRRNCSSYSLALGTTDNVELSLQHTSGLPLLLNRWKFAIFQKGRRIGVASIQEPCTLYFGANYLRLSADLDADVDPAIETVLLESFNLIYFVGSRQIVAEIHRTGRGPRLTMERHNSSLSVFQLDLAGKSNTLLNVELIIPFDAKVVLWLLSMRSTFNRASSL